MSGIGKVWGDDELKVSGDGEMSGNNEASGDEEMMAGGGAMINIYEGLIVTYDLLKYI